MNMSDVWNLMNDSLHIHGGTYSEMCVLQSNAGYYIGRNFKGNNDNFDQPGSRESGYFKTKEEAEKALKEGFDWRNVGENISLYNDAYMS